MPTLHKSNDRREPASYEPANPKKKFWIWIERLALVCGLALLGVYAAARLEGQFSSRAALEKFAALEPSASVANRSDEASTNALPQEMNWPASDLRPTDEAGERDRVQDAAEPGTPLGVLRIAKIRLEVPVLEGTDALTLNRGAGRIAGTARPGEQGNIGIAGHRDGFFRGLKDVAVGDAIELKTLQGTDNYVVDQIRIVTPDRVEVLQARGVPSLTLITCYPFYFIGSAPKRYIVTASLQQEIKSEPEVRSAVTKRTFQKEEQ
jgi:sortase A